MSAIVIKYQFRDEVDQLHGHELKRLVASTGDAAFAVDSEGKLVAWNEAAETLFGLEAEEVLGQPCENVLCGGDQCGTFCGPNCLVRQAVAQHLPIAGFDLLCNLQGSRKWCNITILHAESDRFKTPSTVHIIRPIDVQKRLEILLKDFLQHEKKHANGLVQLTRRELEVLRLAAQSATAEGIATSLNISRTTVNNHLQRIMRKLNAHTKLEAIRRAEAAGLL